MKPTPKKNYAKTEKVVSAEQKKKDMAEMLAITTTDKKKNAFKPSKKKALEAKPL